MSDAEMSRLDGMQTLTLNSFFWSILVLGLVLGSAGNAFADKLLGALNTPAIEVRYPAHALLIGVTHAGVRLVAVGGHGVIVYSDDNGKSWRQASVPVSETITCVAFADPRNGWAAGGQGAVLHTIDGGNSWQLQLNGTQILKLMAYAAAQFASKNPTDDAARISVRRSAIFDNAGDDKPFLSIVSLSPESAMIFGAYRMAVQTIDGGKNWADWSLHVGDPTSHNIYAATQVGALIYLAGESGVVLKSDDQGQSFAMLTVPDPSTLFGIMATPAGTLLSYGVAGEVFRSTDEGRTWEQANISASSDLTDGAVLKSGKVLVISEDGGVFESEDDGLTFQDLPLNEGMALFALTQAANGDVVFVGSGGVRDEPADLFK